MEENIEEKVDSQFVLKEVKGDLFGCNPAASLAHCISEDCRLGKGIAQMFKKKFGGIGELKSQQKKTGGVAVLKRKHRFIYNLVTKKSAWDKPTYKSLRSSLEALKKHCVSHDVRLLCMPKIGCGLDGLIWEMVKEIIGEVFRGINISVKIYSL
ncbi:OARD1 (predicted) [Pycnogonum litorale]